MFWLWVAWQRLTYPENGDNELTEGILKKAWYMTWRQMMLRVGRDKILGNNL